MARLFNGTTQYLSNANAVLTATPLTMACFCYPTQNTASQVLMSIGVSGSGDNRFTMLIAGAVGGDPIRATSRTTSAVNADTTTGYSINTWQHACAVFASATDRRAYLNGGGEGTNTVSNVPTGLNNTLLAASQGAAVANFAATRLAEVGVWNVALNTSEIAALAKGVSPLRIRPNALVAYWPLFGVGSPEPDYSNGGFHLTLNAAPTQIDHAPVMPAFAYQQGWQGAFGAAAAPAGWGMLLSDSRNKLVIR